MVRLIVPINQSVVSQRYEYQSRFQEDVENLAAIPGWVAPISQKVGYCTKPAPVRFVWETDDKTAEFQLSATADFEKILHRASGCTECDVYNLEIGETFYWRVGDSEVYTFRTENLAPRWINIDGSWNIRDAGGFRTIEGKRVKQGMILRGAAFDDDGGDSDLFQVTPEGLDVVHNRFGIRCDLDLRGAEQADEGSVYPKSPLGDDILYLQIGARSYDDFFYEPDVVVKLIRVFTDRSNYPIYYHCAVGSDRTGTLAVVLDAICGLSYEDICMNYELSSLSFPDDRRSRNYDSFQDLLKSIEKYGSNIYERVRGYLLAHGITEEEIETIREIMLEDAQ